MGSARFVALVGLVMLLAACTDAPASRSPDGTTLDGLWLMVMNDDCEGDCEEPPLGMGGRYYYLLSCEPVDEAFLGDAIAVADPESVITVYYEAARPIAGIDVEKVVAVGPESPSACDSRYMRGWFAARSQDYLYDDPLTQHIASLAPGAS